MVCLLVRQFGTANTDFSSRIYQISTTHLYILIIVLYNFSIQNLQDVQNCSLNTSDQRLCSGHHPINYLVVQIPYFVVQIPYFAV